MPTGEKRRKQSLAVGRELWNVHYPSCVIDFAIAQFDVVHKRAVDSAREAPLHPTGGREGLGLLLADAARSAAVGLVGAVRGMERRVSSRAEVDMALRSDPSSRCRLRDLCGLLRDSRVRRLGSWIDC